MGDFCKLILFSLAFLIFMEKCSASREDEILICKENLKKDTGRILANRKYCIDSGEDSEDCERSYEDGQAIVASTFRECQEKIIGEFAPDLTPKTA